MQYRAVSEKIRAERNVILWIDVCQIRHRFHWKTGSQRHRPVSMETISEPVSL
jgi:hypothetical protein